MSEEDCTERGTMVYYEISSIIKRYCDESDITAYEILGALECAKADMLDRMRELTSNGD